MLNTNTALEIKHAVKSALPIPCLATWIFNEMRKRQSQQADLLLRVFSDLVCNDDSLNCYFTEDKVEFDCGENIVDLPVVSCSLRIWEVI